MTDTERAITAARAAADRQIAHVDATIRDILLPAARNLLAGADATDAWALLSSRLRRQLSDQPGFMADLLARLALTHANES